MHCKIDPQEPLFTFDEYLRHKKTLINSYNALTID